MGSQRYLIEDLQRKGILEGEVPMPLVKAIERIRSIGDNVGGVVNAWAEGDPTITRDVMLLTTHRLLGEASADMSLIAYWTGKLGLE